MNHLPQEEAIKGAFFGALVGDALCLGSHYEYDAAKIFKAYGNKPIDKFMSPGEMTKGHFLGPLSATPSVLAVIMNTMPQRFSRPTAIGRSTSLCHLVK